MKVLISGAGGFVGDALARRLAAAGHEVTGLFRTEVAARGWMKTDVVGDLEKIPDFRPLTEGADAIVHLAARVHMMRETAVDPLAAYRRTNVEVTRRLAEAATATGAGRFVFLSSIKVNGERTAGRPFTEADPPAPEDPYGISKLEAERLLRNRAGTVILRTPLVYGPGVGANFRALLRICDTPLPLPLDGIRSNHRSLLFLGNLTHAIARVLATDGGGVYLLSDGEDLSTAGLVRRIRFSLHRRAVPFPLPARCLRAAAALAGRSAAADRLCGSLEVDSRRFRAAFDWAPPFTVGQGLAATAAWYRTAA